MKKIFAIEPSVAWMFFCMVSAILSFAIAHAQTTSEDLANPILDPSTSFPGEYDMLRGFTRDSQRPADSCKDSGVGTCSDVVLMRMANPVVAGDVFSFDVEVKVANEPGPGTDDRSAIEDPGAAGDRTKLGNVIGNGLVVYLTYAPDSLGGVNRFTTACTPSLDESKDSLLSVGFSDPTPANNQGDVGAYTWTNNFANFGPGNSFSADLKQIPFEEFGYLATVSCNLAASAINANTLAQVSFHALSFNQFNQLTGASAVVESYAVTAANDLINYPLDGTGLYMADAKFAGNNQSVYVYIASAGDTDLPVALGADGFTLTGPSVQSSAASYQFNKATSLGTDDLNRAVFLLTLADETSVTESLEASLGFGFTDAANYAYSLQETSGAVGNQTRTLYPHHPDKPFIESIAVGPDSAFVEVNFSDDVFTNRDGTGDLTAEDFDVVFYGSQANASVSDITKVSDSQYRLTISGVVPDTVGSSDLVEVRSAERAEDKAYKSLKTIYVAPADASNGRQGVYALQGAVAALRGELRYTARFDPNPATENTDNRITVFVGRAGDTIGDLNYTNITLSCASDSRINSSLSPSASIAEGDSEISIGTIALSNNEDSDGTVSCTISANIDGASEATTLDGVLVLRDDDNAPIDITASAAAVTFSESDGSAPLDAGVILNDPDGPAAQGNTPGGSNNPDNIRSLEVAISIQGKDNGNLVLRSGRGDGPAAKLSYSGTKPDGQSWLRSIEVATVDGRVPPASAEVTVTVVSEAEGNQFGNAMVSYTISVRKESRYGQGMIADDFESLLGVSDSSPRGVIESAVATYCGSGYYDDFDVDGVPNNVEMAIGTDCTLAHEADFVGMGRPVFTVQSTGQTIAYSIAPSGLGPDDLSMLEVTCWDPDGEENVCRAVKAYVTESGGVCTDAQIGGAFESACDTAFSTEYGSYTAPPGLVNVVWLGIGSDGDWAHVSMDETSMIDLSNQDFYLAPILSVQFNNPRAGASGWVYGASDMVSASIILPATHPNAGGFTLPPLRMGPVTLYAGSALSEAQVRQSTVILSSPQSHGGSAGGMLELMLDKGSIPAIAGEDKNKWYLGQGPEADWLYSSRSLQTAPEATIVADDSLNTAITASLTCGGMEVSFVRRDQIATCTINFTGGVTHWGYYVRGYTSTSVVLIDNADVGDDFELGAQTDAARAVASNSFNALKARASTATVVFEVLNVVVAVKNASDVTEEQREFSFPISDDTSPNPLDRDLDGVLDDNTVGDIDNFVANRVPNLREAFLSVAGNHHIGIGPNAYSSNFAYDSGADISVSRRNDAVVKGALSKLGVVRGIGVYDFYVKSDVAFDDQPVRVSILLRRGLPEDAGYWIYDGENWNSHSKVYSALKPCPPIPAPGPVDTTSSDWSDGLTSGHSCVLVELTDNCSANAGGASGSGDINPGCGTISDIATITEGAEVVTVFRGGGGGGSMGWMLLSGLLIAMLASLVPLMRRKKLGNSN